MNELNRLREIRGVISIAREACAGSDVNNYGNFKGFLDKAILKVNSLYSNPKMFLGLCFMKKKNSTNIHVNTNYYKIG